MTSKFFSKTVKKTTLWSVIIAVILAAAIAVCALWGFHKDVALDDYNSLTVSVNSYAYDNNKDKITQTCEKTFKEQGVKAKYVIEGDMAGDDCELVFVFDKAVQVVNLEAPVKNALKAGFATADISVSAANEVEAEVLAKHFILRGVIAGAVFAVLALAYVSIRYKKVGVGLVVACSVVLGMLLTAALVILTRVYVTTAIAGVIGVAGLLTAAMTMLTVGKIQAAQKEGTEEDVVPSSVAVKENLLLAGALVVGLVLVAILGKTAGLWFAASAFIGVLAATFVSLFFAPAMYASVKAIADKKPAKNVYVGAKKTSKKQKKSFAKVEETPVEETPVEEAPVEETPVEEAPVEETPVEEAPVEETPVEEAPVEETPVEETPVEEAPVEEAPVEETPVEEAPAEEKTEE